MKQIVLPLMLSMFGCVASSVQNNVSNNEQKQDCLDEKEVEASLTKSVGYIGATAADFKLLDSLCEKRVYVGKGYKIVLNLEDNGEMGMSMSAYNPNEKNIDVEACLARAVKTGSEMSTYASPIFEAYKEAYPQKWKDKDLGASNFLSCPEEMTSQERIRLIIMFHEMVHYIHFKNGGDSLYFPAKDKYLCFNLSKDLPLRSVASWDKKDFGDYTPHSQAEIETLEKTYIRGNDQSSLMLFDEFNSYISQLDFMSGELEKNDLEGFNLFKWVPISQANIMGYYVMRYIEYVAENKPKTYESNFGANSVNRPLLLELFQELDKTYAKWLEIITEKDIKPKKVETETYDMLLKMRKKYLGN